ncbi:MAG: acetyl-CoA hydrolase/transferase C-terminal domain-containing protein [Alcanivoracaceae bacterium]|jgi:acyl-CoA hydrolase|nr:acetyl-CoA hydrolase/transferase C-terminal domain-containing protein [Alcanivoracaceae bacterium]
MTQRVTSAAQAVDRVLETVGGEIRLGLPLGLGKPNRFVNELYRRACEDPHISLSIYTALSLGRPKAGSDLEKRFLNPFVERVFGDYEELDYLRDLRAGKLPENVIVSEFFFQPGSMLANTHAQQHYISSNYTHAPRDINQRRVNVVAQMVAPVDEQSVSLSCNPEITLDLLPLLQARRAAGEAIMVIGQLHNDLPKMTGDAQVSQDAFDLLIDDAAAQTTLFSTPNMPVDLQDHFVGLHASSLLRDGGLIQIGIGSLGDALVHHALKRALDNDRYQDICQAAGMAHFSGIIDSTGGLGEFRQGLYGCSEMVTAALLALFDAGVIRRPVYDDLTLQTLINEGALTSPLGPHAIDVLLQHGVIQPELTGTSLAWLQRFGIIDSRIQLNAGQLLLPDSQSVANDINNGATRDALAPFIGKRLLGGTLLHGGFFLGPEAFYARLRALDAWERSSINMTRISFVNQLYGDEQLKRAQRQHGRFFNTAFTMTALGAGVADQVEDGRVLSGVGGQYNFVAQAHELDDARSVLMLRSWRERGGEAASNIVWSYGHNTIPRHLRDIVVTEYGIADLRGRNDSEVVQAMLNITDSRFQESLLQQAKSVGKLSADYQVPELFRANRPERLSEVRAQFSDADFPVFPMGCDFSAVEQQLITALGWLKRKMSQKEYLQLGRAALMEERDHVQHFSAHLQRMGLAAPQSMKERLYRRLLLTALTATAG